ncbi:MAG: hypothetical protein IT512_10575 [Rhodocyclaceae bacterium]|jgi:hypothetical protein|nr:hypothetical protein [Rhodocyclaceae bacterium]
MKKPAEAGFFMERLLQPVSDALADRVERRAVVDIGRCRRRGIRAVSATPPQARLEAGDVVVLLGEPDGLAAGEGRLLKG